MVTSRRAQQLRLTDGHSVAQRGAPELVIEPDDTGRTYSRAVRLRSKGLLRSRWVSKGPAAATQWSTDWLAEELGAATDAYRPASL